MLAGIGLEVRSPAGGYRATGLVEAGSRRFRVEARGERSLGAGGDLVAVGMPRSGEQAPFREEDAGNEDGPRRCWMGTHAPVGANRATASVQEAVHLIVATLEGARSGIQRAREVKGREGSERRYTVRLGRAAARRPNESSFYREVNLRQKLAGPVRVTVSAQGVVTGLRFQLRGYRPIFGWEAKKLSPRPVSIEAEISRTAEELDLEPPPCVGTE